MVVYTGSATPELERMRMEIDQLKRKLESKKRVFARFSRSTAEDYGTLKDELDSLKKEHNAVLTGLKGLAGAFLSKFPTHGEWVG